MIIHPPQARQENGQFIISARIEHQSKYEFPNELWFSVDEQHGQYVSHHSDIFLSSLIRTARAIGEDIDVRSQVSPQLLFGMREYLKLHAAWSRNPQVIEIRAQHPVRVVRTVSSAASCNISGGIDSFYTLWSQLPENEPIPEMQVKYGIYGSSLTSPAQNDIFQRQYLPGLAASMAEMGIELISVETNAHEFRTKDDWIALSPARIAVAQLFSPVISTHFLPSTDTYQTLKPWGTHPMSDHLFSLETLKIFTHAPDLLRFEKFQAMAQWPLVHDYLFVCNNASAHLNDSTCPKCTRTMLMANLLGIEQKLKTFHLPFRKRSLLRRVAKGRNHFLGLMRMLVYARRHGRWEMMPFIIVPMVIQKMTNWIKPLLGYKFR